MKKTKLYKIAGFLIKLSIIVLTFGFIIRELLYKKDTLNIYLFFSELNFDWRHYALFFLALALMVLNWALETLKWQYLIAKIEKVTFLKAYKAVLSGITVSTFTPNRTGEYAGRVFVLEPENRWRGVILTIVGSLSQLSSTLFTGLVCLFFFLPHMGIANPISTLIYVFLVMSLFAVFFFFFKISLVYKIFEKLKFLKKPLKYLLVLKDIGSYDLYKILKFSVLRHIVFSLQFYLLFYAFGLQLNVAESFMLTSVVFFIMAAIPTVALTELGVRGAVSLYIFDMYFGSHICDLELIVLSSAFFLWLINLVLPALAGAVLITRFKFFKPQPNERI